MWDSAPDQAPPEEKEEPSPGIDPPEKKKPKELNADPGGSAQLEQLLWLLHRPPAHNSNQAPPMDLGGEL